MRPHPPQDNSVILPFANGDQEPARIRASLCIKHMAADGSRLTLTLDSDATLLVEFTAAEPRDGGDARLAAKSGFLTEWQQVG